MQIRLQKYLADNGVASRRKSEELIREGRVAVNGVTVTGMGLKIDTRCDQVFVDGVPTASKEDYIYIMLHKPEGCVCTVADQFDRKTVMDYLGPEITQRVFPVGRLDYNTSGLLLLTNDGNLTYGLTHPKHGVDKVYTAKISGLPTDIELNNFRRGLIIDGIKTCPAKIQITRREEKFCSVRITITQGRNRQVRKMCEAIGHPVLSLKRIATGKIFLGELKKGAYRRLTDDEISYLKSLCV